MTSRSPTLADQRRQARLGRRCALRIGRLSVAMCTRHRPSTRGTRQRRTCIRKISASDDADVAHLSNWSVSTSSPKIGYVLIVPQERSLHGVVSVALAARLMPMRFTRRHVGAALAAASVQPRSYYPARVIRINALRSRHADSKVTATLAVRLVLIFWWHEVCRHGQCSRATGYSSRSASKVCLIAHRATLTELVCSYAVHMRSGDLANLSGFSTLKRRSSMRGSR